MNIPVNNDVTTIAENFKHVILFLQKGKSEVCSTVCVSKSQFQICSLTVGVGLH